MGARLSLASVPLSSLPALARTKEHKELLEWAKRVSGLGEQFDPLKDPNVTQMNYEGRWENHVEAYMRACGDPALPKRPRDEDEFEDEEDEVFVL
ncbi:hypothetical protein NLJ89_g10808 [Agrocybe chaxingu]|uniref:Uncharacterized protein n=1 Tax=Agrocybe chaxingu TaxID=84603 RepID=A0A9W8MS89_9AGAR|nr:hypothetical protein NLJ89_g10808 [Agrocybe chaxingu]